MKKKNLLYIVCALARPAPSLRLRRFLNKDPQDKQVTNDTYWQIDFSLRTYAQDFYSSYFISVDMVPTILFSP